MAEMIAHNEIRIFLHKGLIQHIGLGKGIPPDLVVTVADSDVDGTGEAKIEDNGFGDQCVLPVWKNAESECHNDENGITWI